MNDTGGAYTVKPVDYCRYCGHDGGAARELGRNTYALGFCAGTLFGGMIVLGMWLAWVGAW